MLKLITRRDYILKYIRENQPCSLLQISSGLGFTEGGIIRALSLLRRKGEILRILPDGAAYRRHNFLYKLTDSDLKNSYSSDVARKLSLSIYNSKEELANELEKKQFWRRAATVWCELATEHKSVADSERMLKRVNECIKLSSRRYK
ncbi:PerC family transcriptional regulator [Citrobacter amalonaticus]|uniref:PerC family transcriptional regulator n=1 Tax=Citrobacter amalonaticus TaxID=35703 RepID=UPI001A2DDB80|nr:PerC family transcriptional regulator [Citrobacter amalonaticus]HDQ2813311.1 PerC family transcriptional regulator [Citrobacter amalonaticus]